MRRVIRKRTPVELIVACMENEGVKPVEGQSRTGWLNAHYEVTADPRRNQYVARRREATGTPPRLR